MIRFVLASLVGLTCVSSASALNISSGIIQNNVPLALSSNTPTSAPSGTGSGYVCVDSNKKTYIKTSCP